MELVFFLEELSAKVFLEGLLPRLLPDIACQYVVFEGKNDLERQLVKKLRAWQKPECRFIVLRDRDGGDCLVIKNRLAQLCQESGQKVLIRIACRELETWYLGDLQAVGQAFDDEKIARLQGKEMFRNPDSLGNPVEELIRLVPDFQKNAGGRRLGKVVSLDNNFSKSFRAFIAWVRKVAGKTVD